MVNKIGFETHRRNKHKNGKKGMNWCSEKRQEKDLYKLWNCHNGEHPSIDKIEGSLKKLTRVLSKPNSISKNDKSSLQG